MAGRHILIEKGIDSLQLFEVASAVRPSLLNDAADLLLKLGFAALREKLVYLVMISVQSSCQLLQWP